MQRGVTKQISRDKTLDYLFQISGEEQFETLKFIVEAPQRRQGLVGRVSSWFKKDAEPQSLYPDGYYADDN